MEGVCVEMLQEPEDQDSCHKMDSSNMQAQGRIWKELGVSMGGEYDQEILYEIL